MLDIRRRRRFEIFEGEEEKSVDWLILIFGIFVRRIFSKKRSFQQDILLFLKKYLWKIIEEIARLIFNRFATQYSTYQT